MAKSVNRAKGIMQSKSEYSYICDEFLGADLTSANGKCDRRRFPYLVNMYRDKDKADGAQLESFPGYRKLPILLMEEGVLHGIYTHTFTIDGEKEAYVIVHKGAHLYCFSHQERDCEKELYPIATVKDTPGFGFSYGDYFYFLDGERITALRSPDEAVSVGDEAYTQSMKDKGLLPATNAYVPLAFRNGKAHEARNLLSRYYEVERTLTKEDIPEEKHGLFFREITLDGEKGLEVIGIEAGRTVLCVPKKALFRGQELPILAIAPNAFAKSDLKTAVLAPTVKRVGGGDGTGAFYGCQSLERVVMHGVEEIEDCAFAACGALKTVVLAKSIKSIHKDAFMGCLSLTSVYLESTSLSDVGYTFPSGVVIYGNSMLFWEKKGATLYIPCHTVGYTGIYKIWGGESHALGKFEEYAGVEIEGSSMNGGYSVPCEASTPLIQYFLRGSDEAHPSHYLFVTVSEEDGVPSFRDDVVSFRIALFDSCEAIASVRVDGTEILQAPMASTAPYYVSEADNGIVRAIRAVFPAGKWEGKTVTVRAFSDSNSYDVRDISDFLVANPGYTEDTIDAIRRCRFGAVYDGRVFLGGNPSLPDTVFYSVKTEKRSEFPVFAPTAFCVCRDNPGKIVSLLSHPLYLGVLKESGTDGGYLYALSKSAESASSHAVFAVEGRCGVPCPTEASLSLGEEPLFLAKSGLYALGEGRLWDEGRIENRSHYIDGALKSLCDGARSLCRWKGYLVLLCGGKLFLGDSSFQEKERGVLQYEWYPLEGVGDYQNDALCYRHLSIMPQEDGVRLDRFLLDGKSLCVRGDEAVCESLVKTGTAYSSLDGKSLIVHYTIEKQDGEEVYYLVDSNNERVGGELILPKALVSVDEVLYFACENGALFCVNTDKRGKAVVVSGKEVAVAEDEIHASFYSFDNHAYTAACASAFADMDLPHIAKSTSPKSLVVSCKVMPHALFCVSVATESTPFEKVGQVVASGAFDEKDFLCESFTTLERVSVTLNESKRRFLSKSILFSSSAYCSPFGIDGFAYRYRMAGRIKPS